MVQWSEAFLFCALKNRPALEEAISSELVGPPPGKGLESFVSPFVPLYTIPASLKDSPARKSEKIFYLSS